MPIGVGYGRPGLRFRDLARRLAADPNVRRPEALAAAIERREAARRRPGDGR